MQVVLRQGYTRRQAGLVLELDVLPECVKVDGEREAHCVSTVRLEIFPILSGTPGRQQLALCHVSLVANQDTTERRLLAAGPLH